MRNAGVDRGHAVPGPVPTGRHPFYLDLCVVANICRTFHSDIRKLSPFFFPFLGAFSLIYVDVYLLHKMKL